MAVELGEVAEGVLGVRFVEIRRDGLRRGVVGGGVGGRVLLLGGSGWGEVVGNIKEVGSIRTGVGWGFSVSGDEVSREIGNVTWVGDGTKGGVKKEGVVDSFSISWAGEGGSNGFDGRYGV